MADKPDIASITLNAEEEITIRFINFDPNLHKALFTSSIRKLETLKVSPVSLAYITRDMFTTNSEVNVLIIDKSTMEHISGKKITIGGYSNGK